MEESSSLEGDEWTPLDLGPLDVTEVIEDGVKTYRLQLPLSLNPNRFYRLRVREPE